MDLKQTHLTLLGPGLVRFDLVWPDLDLVMLNKSVAHLRVFFGLLAEKGHAWAFKNLYSLPFILHQLIFFFFFFFFCELAFCPDCSWLSLNLPCALLPPSLKDRTQPLLTGNVCRAWPEHKQTMYSTDTTDTRGRTYTNIGYWRWRAEIILRMGALLWRLHLRTPLSCRHYDVWPENRIMGSCE